MGERWVLSITQECERRTVLVPEIILADFRYFVPVGILTGDLLEIDLALPTMVLTESGRHLKALMHNESPVALKGSGILQLVHKMRKHEDRKVPQCPLIGYLPVLMYSGGIGVVTGVVLRSYMKLMGYPVFRPAQHLETVTKIITVKCVHPSLPSTNASIVPANSLTGRPIRDNINYSPSGEFIPVSISQT